MARAPTKPVQMVYLTIGYSHYLMDLSRAMKVGEWMQHAVNVEWEWDRSDRGNDTYVIGDPVNVEFRTVSADKLRMPRGKETPVQPAQRRMLK